MYKNKKFTNYALGVLISNIGNSLTSLVFPLIILTLTKSPFQLSLISAISLLPYLILGIPFGALIDRLNIKKIMQISDFIRFISYTILFIAYYYMSYEMLIISIYIVSIISGICYVLHSISETTIIKFIVAEEDLVAANSVIYGSQYITSLVAPIIGGVLYKVNYAGYFFLFDAITFLCSFISLYFVSCNLDRDLNEISNINIKNIYIDIKMGFKSLMHKKKIMCILIIIAMLNLTLAPYYNYTMVYLKSINFSSENIGLIVGISSLGSLLGTIFVSKISSIYSQIKIILITLLIDAICRIFIPFTKQLIILILIFSLINLVQAILNIIVITIRQKEVSKEEIGRINSVFKTIVIGMQPIGLFIGGVLMLHFKIINILIMIGLISIIIFIISIVLLTSKNILTRSKK